MQISLEGGKLDVKISFGPSGLKAGYLARSPGVERTVALVEIDGIPSIGASWQNPKDTPNRVIGRKVALRRALAASPLTKVQRSQVWAALVEQGVRLVPKRKGC